MDINFSLSEKKELKLIVIGTQSDRDVENWEGHTSGLYLVNLILWQAFFAKLSQ